MKSSNLFLAFIFVFHLQAVYSQNGALATFTFDDCTAMDEEGLFPLYNIEPSVECVCGVLGDAIELNDDTDTITLDPNIKNVFNSDFTLSLYFWAEEADLPYTLLSIQPDSCSLDSALVIKYNPLNQDLECLITDNIGANISLNTKLSLQNCWHHLVYSKTGTQYSMFLDEEFVDSGGNGIEYTLGVNHDVRLGVSPCAGINEVIMDGLIDQIEIFDRGLSARELSSLNRFPDDIINQDTTIILGNSIQLNTGKTCANEFAWSPSDFLDNTSIPNPVSTPTETITYFYDVEHRTCATRDSVTIFVFESAIECEDLLIMPNVFTPNSDNVNDVFEISNKFALEEQLNTTLSSFEIFDRWGEKMFFSDTKEGQWDGSFKGQLAPNASYVYKIAYQCGGEEFIQTGPVSLVR